jgi:hypothetical protein
VEFGNSGERANLSVAGGLTMPDWFPRRWIDFILAIIVFWLLMMITIYEREPPSMQDQLAAELSEHGHEHLLCGAN